MNELRLRWALKNNFHLLFVLMLEMNKAVDKPNRRRGLCFCAGVALQTLPTQGQQ